MRLKYREYLRIPGAVLALLVMLAPGSLRAEKNVDAIVNHGIELRRAGRDIEGLAEFQRALQMQKSARIQAQVALAEQALGLWPAAEADSLESLGNADDPWIKKNHATLTQALAVIQSHLGSLEVWGSPKGAQILIEGKPVGTLPFAKPLRVLSGDTIIVGARAPGYSEINRTVRIPVGATVREHVELVPLPSPVAAIGPDKEDVKPALPDKGARTNVGAKTSASGSANTAVNMDARGPEDPASPRQDPPPADSHKGLRPYAWAAALGATAGIVFGVVETATAVSKKNEFENHTAPSPDDPTMSFRDCGTANLSAACKPLSDAHDKAVNRAIVGYAVGGALAVGSLVLFVLSSRDDHVSESTVACLPDSSGTGIACRFHF